MPLIAAGGRDGLLTLSLSFLTSTPDPGSLLRAVDGVWRQNIDLAVVIKFFGVLKGISWSVTPLTMLVLLVRVA